MNRLPSLHKLEWEDYRLQFSIDSYYLIGNGSHKYVLRLFQSGEQVEYYMFPSIGAAMDFLNLNFDLSNE